MSFRVGANDVGDSSFKSVFFKSFSSDFCGFPVLNFEHQEFPKEAAPFLSEGAGHGPK
jgi:hypothetical protein